MVVAPGTRARSPRLWPALLVLVLCTLAVLAIWATGEDLHRQGKIERTFAALGLSAIALVGWLAFFSRIRWRRRLTILAVLLLAAALAPAILRIGGVSGDVVPILEWRWSGGPPAAAAPEQPARETDDGIVFPQFLGPTRDGRLRGVGLARDWSAHPPQLVWRRPVGSGWSGFAVAAGRVVTQEQHGDAERVACYELATGDALWVHSDPARFEEPLSGAGPRATPTIVAGRVYTLGGTGILNALELQSGRLLWSVRLPADNGAAVPEYGYSSSPLVFDDLVVVSAGGPRDRALAAYNLSTGAPEWKGGAGGSAYSSPMLADLAGLRQVLVFNDAGLEAVAAEDGRTAWRYAWPGGTQNVSQPIVLGDDRVFVSSGYGVGSELLHVVKDRSGGIAAELLWKSRAMKAKFTNVVEHDGFLYGLDDGILACVAIEDGSRLWKGGRYGHGQLLLVDDLLLIQTERGDVVLVEATPDAHRELARLEALSGKTWNHPSLAAPYLLVRNDREATCWRLALESDSPL